MAFVRTVECLQIFDGLHIVADSNCCSCRPAHCRLSQQLLLTAAAAAGEAIWQCIALIDTQHAHINVDADEATQAVPPTRRYRNAVRDEPTTQGAREVGIGPPALVVVVRRTRRKLR